MTKVKRIEQGWAGHYCRAYHCAFRRNTLVYKKEVKAIVSTVGNLRPEGRASETIGIGHYYETMVWIARHDGTYWEINLDKPIYPKAKNSISECKFETDLEADRMHENIVKEIMIRMDAGEFDTKVFRDRDGNLEVDE